MTSLHNLKNMNRILIAFGAIAGALALVGFEARSSVTSMRAEVDDLYGHDLLGISEIEEANADLISVGCDLRELVIERDKNDVARRIREIEEDVEGLDDNFVSSNRALESDAANAQLTVIRTSLPEYESHTKEMLALVKADKVAE